MRIPAATLLAIALFSGFVAAVDPPGASPDRPTAAVGGAQELPPEINRGPFTLAVLRRDGTVIPFAHFDGRKWSNNWITPNKTFEVPLSLGDVPEKWWPQRRPLTAWTAWPMQRSSRRIEAQGPVLLRAHCQRNVGLRTNWVPSEPPPPDGVQPYPKEGLATAGGAVLVEPVQLLADAAPEWKMVADAASAEATRREREAVRGLGSVWSHPVPEDQRAKTPFELEVVLRGHDRATGWDVYYFEGVKRYQTKPRAPEGRRFAFSTAGGGVRVTTTPPQRQPAPGAAQARGCEILSFASGWLMTQAGRPPVLRLSVVITDCNREGLVYTLPLGALRLNGRLVWILQVSGYGYERYEVVEIRDARLTILQATPGGACG